MRVCHMLQTSRSWSKLNPRETHQKKEPLRKSRIQIKQQGGEIKQRMEYSWTEDGETCKHCYYIRKISFPIYFY